MRDAAEEAVEGSRGWGVFPAPCQALPWSPASPVGLLPVPRAAFELGKELFLKQSSLGTFKQEGEGKVGRLYVDN